MAIPCWLGYHYTQTIIVRACNVATLPKVKEVKIQKEQQVEVVR